MCNTFFCCCCCFAKQQNFRHFQIQSIHSLYVTDVAKFVFDTLENIVVKRENADKQHFLLFPNNNFHHFKREGGHFETQYKCRLQML